MTTNPMLPMTLSKFSKDDKIINLTNDSSVTYDPKTGYTLDLTRLENPYGTYYCNPEGYMSFWKMELVPRHGRSEVLSLSSLN